MHVGRPVVDRNLIRELAGALEVLDGQLEFADDPASVAHPHDGRRGEEVQLLAARHVFAKELEIFDREPASGHHAVGQRAARQPVEIEDMAAVKLSRALADLVHAGR